jgi:hypothetical protein
MGRVNGENRIPRWIVLLEGWGDEDKFEQLFIAACIDEQLREHGATGAIESGYYQLQNRRLKTDWSAG